jgi:hypothetical protein
MRAPLANTRQAQYALLRSRAFLQQVVHQTTHSLARFFLEIDANYKQFKTASRLRAAAALRLESQRAYYEEGRITIDRFLDAVSQYATAVATEAQYKTTYNISIVALEEAKGTLLAYDNIAVAEGPHPGKAYTQARDIQGAHRRFPIAPDGPQVPPRQVGPLNPDPADNNPPPGADEPEGPLPLPAPSGPLGPRPGPLPPYAPVQVRPILSQTGTTNGAAQPGASAGTAPSADVRLTGGSPSQASPRNSASLIDTAAPGTGQSPVAEPPGGAAPRTDQAGKNEAPNSTGAGSPSAAAVPEKAPAPQPEPDPPLPPDDLPPLPVTIDLPPLPQG